MGKILVIGGSSGLGLELAKFGTPIGFTPTVIARTATKLRDDSTFPDDGQMIDMDIKDIGKLWPFANEEFDCVFLTVGRGYQGDFYVQSSESIQEIIDVNLTWPLTALNAFITSGCLYRSLVVVSSRTAYTIKPQEVAYGAAKAGLSQGIRNLHEAFRKTIIGYSFRTSLVHVGGMRTSFWANSDANISGFMDPCEVAATIWNNLIAWENECPPDNPLNEYTINRTLDGKPKVENIRLQQPS